MDQAMVDNPVTLVIKAPNQKYDDQTINCFLDWTVEKLKTHLSKVYPSKPLTKDQRLVYSGKLLLDHLLLKDILRKQDEYHMVHLVCASRTPPNSPKPSTRRESTGTASTSSRASSEHSGSSPASTSQDMPSASSNPRTEDSLRLRHTSHTYMDAMYSHALSYNRQHQAVASSQATLGNASAQPAATAMINSDRPPPNPPRAAPNIVPEANQNVQMNAQGGPVMNEEDINRDWLDWMYTVSRAAILLSIVYFYSSFSRFVMVMGAMILVYMHQAGWFPFRQEEGQARAQEDAPDVNRDRVNNNDLLEMERHMDEGINENRAGERGQEAPVVPHPGLVASAWSFITTLFTSLIPEGPPQVVN
ncbi:homocysteine-responsive endoplasmic reticulum-resident ubiquitin-like domain member 2 protein isoform X2 [Pseudophryne corroboree]|uniref:homocysteine-responsive endoplasmic reticulum-resident ubiquitin-like domain member 2 protein isoform X2 n=1 Tax=Pseudophryne corroboree TaxID=495146 RepID=UPI003081ACD4